MRSRPTHHSLKKMACAASPVLLFLFSACSSAPRGDMSFPPSTIRASEIGGTDSQLEGSSGEAKSLSARLSRGEDPGTLPKQVESGVYWYLTPTAGAEPKDALSSGSATLERMPPPTGVAREEGEPPAEARRASSINDLPYESLLNELEARLTEEWTSLPGGLGEAGDEEAESQRIEASKRLMVLAFLRDRQCVKSRAMEEAVQFAMAKQTEDLELLLMAYLKHTGQDEEAGILLMGICSKEAPSQGGDDPSPPATFELAALSFAKSIEGPGHFLQARQEDIAPGRMLLVYGEFRNFRSVEEGGSAAAHYRQAFSALLRLLTSTGEEIDRLDFLPESRGSQVASSTPETVNFWARYRFPARLQPGKYRLLVEAKDVLGGSSASGALEFEINEPPEPAGKRPGEKAESSRAASERSAQGTKTAGASKKPLSSR